MSGKEKKEEEICENADKNPLCPYLTRIESMDTKIDTLMGRSASSESNIDWLKKGYWFQVGLFIASLAGMAVFILGHIFGHVF